MKRVALKRNKNSYSLLRPWLNQMVKINKSSVSDVSVTPSQDSLSVLFLCFYSGNLKKKTIDFSLTLLVLMVVKLKVNLKELLWLRL